jgi:hypothetical protein
VVHQADADGCKILLSLDAGSGTHIYLGDGAVTSSTGFIFDGSQLLQLDMTPGSALYGLAHNGTVIVSKLVFN